MTSRPSCRLHELDLPVDGTMILGRLVVARPWRRRSREVTVGLYGELVRLALELGVRRGVSFVTESAIRWYRLGGIPLKVVGPPRQVTGAPRSPAVFDVEVLDGLPRERHRRGAAVDAADRGPDVSGRRGSW